MSRIEEQGWRSLVLTGVTFGGVTGRGDDSSEAISRRGESCLHKYGNYKTGQL